MEQSQLREYNDYIRITKNYLRKFRQFHGTAINKRERLQMLRCELGKGDEGITAPVVQYGVDRGNGYSELNSVEARVASRKRKLELIAKVEADLEGLEHICSMIERSVGMLSDRDRALIELHYFEGMSWSQVADREYITEKWASKRGAHAVRAVAGMLFGDAVGSQNQLFVFAL